MDEERYYKATITRRDIGGIRIETAWARSPKRKKGCTFCRGCVSKIAKA